MSGLERLSAALADRYRIERQLGQGGMATVYLAADLKHDRKVALKVLKPELAAVLGAERFVVEIKTTASLQHPHILPLFDSGTADGFLFYVMPFIEGETLRDKLNRETQLGVDEAVRIAREVADALDYAHRRGVIHRDIKPENILLHDGRPMVADFGIALAVSAAAGGRMTETGLSLGTPHYMSPEQATADKEISGRSDVYSLASVLYEMLAGQPPHLGGSAQQIIMKIIAEQPQAVTVLRKSVPPNVAAALAKALEKLPADRFESAKAFGDALSNPAFVHRAGTTAPAAVSGPPRTWNRVTVALAAIATVLALLLGAKTMTPSNDRGNTDPVVRFSLADDPSLRIETGMTRPFAISPDGRTIVFRASTESTPPQLWVRTVDDPKARPLEGTRNGGNAAISPDGNWVAFVVGNLSLRKVRIAGGDASPIAQLDAVTAAISWASDDEIVLEQIAPDGGIHRVNASGGRPALLVPIDSAAGETRQRRPVVLRDGGVVVYGSYTQDADEPTLVLYRMSDGRRARLGIASNGALALIDDRLVYSMRDGTLMAVRIDVQGLKMIGAPVQMTPRVASLGTGNTVGLSEAGTLVYRSAGATGAARLELTDTLGTLRRIPGEFAIQSAPRFSPDGRRLAVGIIPAGIGSRVPGLTSDLWIIDVATGEPTRVTSGDRAAAPEWSLDARRLIYLAAVDTGFEVWSAAVDGSAQPGRVASARGFFSAMSMVPDGKSVIVQAIEAGAIARGAGLLRIWIDGSERVDTVIAPTRGGLRPEEPRVSPDGRWVAFVDRTTTQVWVRSLSGPTLLQVSTTGAGGNPVVWGADSRRLLYASAALRVTDGDQPRAGMVVIELETEPTLAVAQRRLVRGLPPNEGYDLHPDGKTFVVVTTVGTATPIHVAFNWANEARRAWRAAKQ